MGLSEQVDVNKLQRKALSEQIDVNKLQKKALSEPVVVYINSKERLFLSR